MIEHGGDYASGSAYFSLNWKNGNTIIELNDQRAMAASEVGNSMKEHIFVQATEVSKELSSPSTSELSTTAKLSIVVGKPKSPTSSLELLADKNRQDSERQNTEKLEVTKKRKLEEVI